VPGSCLELKAKFLGGKEKKKGRRRHFIFFVGEGALGFYNILQ